MVTNIISNNNCKVDCYNCMVIFTKNDLLNSYLKTYNYRTYVIENILLVYVSRFKKPIKINHSLKRCELLINRHER